MKDLFSYVPPTDETSPKYAELRAEEDYARLINPVGPLDPLIAYRDINHRTRVFHETIERLCPPSADRAAAQRCVRLARMLANEAVGERAAEEKKRLHGLALDQLLLARMQACASIALAE
jgi:hypothetical protein